MGKAWMAAAAIGIAAMATEARAQHETTCQVGAEGAAWAGYDKGVKWERSLDKALERAKAEHKLVLYFQLVGELDKEGC